MHIWHRGNNRARIFLAEHDYRRYLACMEELLRDGGCDIHAFALMPNHIHLLLTPRAAISASKFMQRLEQRHAQFINRFNKRTGALYEGRFKSSVIEDSEYLFNCYRYIELNPVRAGIVDHPSEYEWSSYMSNAEGTPSFLLKPHPLFMQLGEEDETRRCAYRAMFRKPLGEETLHEMRGTSRGEIALGSAQFKVRWAAGPAPEPRGQTPGSDPGFAG